MQYELANEDKTATLAAVYNTTTTINISMLEYLLLFCFSFIGEQMQM